MEDNIIKSYQNINIGICFRVFLKYFKDKKDFESFYNNLSEIKQNKFFKLTKFYKDFIYNSSIKDKGIQNYFSLIMIFSLIEATMSEENHLFFDQYLSNNFTPIPDKKVLREIQNKYYENFGAQKKVKKFINDYVDSDCKKLFSHAICFNNEKERKSILNEDERIKKNIELFYQWRSKFVHEAEIPMAFQLSGIRPIIKNEKNVGIATSAYQKSDFEQFFEHGFLRYFGYKKDFKHEYIKEKIERYKNHTLKSAWDIIYNNFKKIMN